MFARWANKAWVSARTAGLVAFLALAIQVSADPIRIGSGLISGDVTDQDGIVRVYKGIPYAASPTGDLRWKAPAAPSSPTKSRP